MQKLILLKLRKIYKILKQSFLEKNGQITQQFKTLGSLDPEKRKEFASNLNKIKDDLPIK